jgi:hypothetical protein
MFFRVGECSVPGRLWLGVAAGDSPARIPPSKLRTAIAAVVPMLLARALKLPEFYWALLSTIAIRVIPSGAGNREAKSPAQSRDLVFASSIKCSRQR